MTRACVYDCVAISRSLRTNKLIPLGGHGTKQAREPGRADCSSRTAVADVACGEHACAAAAARVQGRAEGDMEQVLHRQADRLMPELLRGQLFRSGGIGKQSGPLDDDDTLPRLWRHGRGHVVALADRQITQPPSCIAGLAQPLKPAPHRRHAR